MLTPRLPLAAALGFAAACLAAPAGAQDLLITGGPIYTGVEAQPTAKAVAVTAGRIVAVGDLAAVRAKAAAGARAIDLKGAALFPGFTDAHAPLAGVGERELTLNLEGSGSAAEVARRLAAYLAQRRPTRAVFGRGWIETGWPEGRFLERGDLDAVARGLPVVLRRADGHAVTANSAALKAAGVDRNTKDPPGGQIVKDAQGEPTGMLVDKAMALVAGLATDPTEADRLAAYRAAFKVEAAYGWTGLHNMSVPWRDVALLEAMAARGEAPLRVYNAIDAGQAGPLFDQGKPRRADHHPGGQGLFRRRPRLPRGGATGALCRRAGQSWPVCHGTAGHAGDHDQSPGQRRAGRHPRNRRRGQRRSAEALRRIAAS